MPRAYVGFVALSACLLMLSAAATAEEPQHRTVVTNGDATVYVVPDEVIVNLAVASFDRDLDRSKADNDQRGSSLVKAVRNLGVEEKDIHTDTMSVQLAYKDSSHPSFGIEGYHVRRAYAVTLRDVKLFEKLTDVSLKSGANELLGFEFRTSDLRKHRDQARKMAVKAAREKAEALAGELECKIGKPRTITEGGGGGYWGMNVLSNGFVNAAQAAPGGGGGGEELPLGQISIRADVSVTFDLE